MYIRKQPSGNTDINADAAKKGRGEYEVSEKFVREDGREVAARDLHDRRLLVRFGRYGYRETGNVVKLTGGKTRMRLDEPRRHIHLARQVQAALLFPKSRRDESGFVGGEPTIWHERYIVRKMHFKGLRLRADRTAYVRLGELELDNGSQTAHVVAFGRRMKLVEHLHNRSDQFPDAIKTLLDQHKAILVSDEPIEDDGEGIVTALMSHVAENAPDYNVEYVLGGDVVPVLVDMIDAPPVEQPANVELIAPEDMDIRLREAAKWRRWVAARGPKSARFRRDVRNAYDSTCIVCGIKLPLSKHCRVPGVDSAHILPWATHDLDVVGNGVCLCKLHHWAFDQQLIAIYHEGGTYSIVVTERAAKSLDENALALLGRHAGPLPVHRLPINPNDRPRAQFLAKRDELLGD